MFFDLIKHSYQMKKLIIPIVAIVLAFSASAFTAKKTSTILYQYVGSGTSQTNIQDINNYVRTEDAPCDEGSDVCGVVLNDNGVGNPPATADFNGEKTNLWLSQQNGSAQDGAIEMKP